MKIRFQHTGKVLAWLIRGLAKTLTYEVIDHACILHSEVRPPVIWTFWHNRMFLMPYVHQLWLPHVHGCILSSPSGDGQVIADVCAEFGFKPVRGSSSRQGMSALITLAEMMKQGYDVGITPDGPRGPRRVAAAGVAQLAAVSGVALLPCAAQTSRRRIMRSWDRMVIPLPFGRGVVVCGEPIQVPRDRWQDALPQIQAALNAAADRADLLCPA